MIGNNPFNTFYPTKIADNGNAARQLKKYTETAAFRKKAGLEGDGTDGSSFAAKLKQADEFLASGESAGAADTVGIVLRQMREMEVKEVVHNGVRVVVTKDSLRGNSITIGGSATPDWIQVSTSVGTVNIDLNDLDSLMKCLDMFSPEDLNAILRKITEVRQARDAMREIDEAKNTPIQQAEKREDEEER